ncbi:MAG: MFS transporter, partial [Chloroflexi bacterium]|nr:MFS transporter [Chloroflexota bacterium]
MRVAEGEQVEGSWWRTAPLLLAATLAHVGVAIGVQIMPPLVPFYQEELGLSRAQVGTIVGAIYCGSMLASFPAGRAVDVVGVRRMLALSVVLMGVPVGLFALSTSLWPVLAAAVVGGLGYGAATPVSTRAVMDWFHGRIRGTAMGVKQTGMPLGGALVSATAPALAVAFGWRVALGFFSLFIMALAALCFVWYRDAEQPAAR